MQEILDRYGHNDSPYLFPIIRDTAKDAVRQYRSCLLYTSGEAKCWRWKASCIEKNENSSTDKRKTIMALIVYNRENSRPQDLRYVPLQMHQASHPESEAPV